MHNAMRSNDDTKPQPAAEEMACAGVGDRVGDRVGAFLAAVVGRDEAVCGLCSTALEKHPQRNIEVVAAVVMADAILASTYCQIDSDKMGATTSCDFKCMSVAICNMYCKKLHFVCVA